MNVREYNIAVDKYSDGVYRFILKNIRDEERAKDIVQESFTKMWVNHEGVNFEKVKSYLYSTAYHTMIDLIRKEKRIVDFENVRATEYAHSEQYSDLGEILDEAIKQLPDDQRSVVLLRDYEGYSYKEIADITGLNEPQVKVYIFRARKHLKNYIGSTEAVV